MNLITAFFSSAADGTLFLHVINRKRGGWTVEIMRKHHSCVYCSGNVCSRQTWDLLLTWGKWVLKQMEKMNQDKDTKVKLQNTQNRKYLHLLKEKLNFLFGLFGRKLLLFLMFLLNYCVLYNVPCHFSFSSLLFPIFSHEWKHFSICFF